MNTDTPTPPMNPFTTPPQDGTPPPPLSPQPIASPQSGQLAPGTPVEFALTPPPAPSAAAPPAPLSPFGSELPATPSPQPVAAAPAVMMTTKEAIEMLEELFAKGEYQKVADGADDVLAADPGNAEALALKTNAIAAIADPAAAKKLRAAARRRKLQKTLLWVAAGVVVLAAAGVAAWQLLGDRILPPVVTPPVESMTLSVATQPTPAEGVAPFTITFTVRNVSLPQGVVVTFDVGDGVDKPAPLTHTFVQPGTYTVVGRAKAADGRLLDEHTETVTVTGVLETRASATVGVDGQTVTFASTVVGAEGDVSYAWSFGDNTTSSEANPTHAYSVPGSYEATLTVTTPDGSTGTAATTVKITGPVVTQTPSSSAPRGAVDAVITTIPKSQDGLTLTGAAPFTVLFSSGSSRSENGEVVTASWDFGDSFDAQAPSAVHTYSRPGLYKLTLTVTDDAGITGTETMTVNVLSTEEPVATASVGTSGMSPVIETDVKPIGSAPFSITFDGARSSSPAGSIVAYEWDFGDGSTLGSGALASHVYEAPGRYDVVLTITDSAGKDATQRLTVVVA